MWRGLLILCLLKTALGQSRTASLALGTVVPASSGKGGLDDISALSWRHVLKSCRERTGAKGIY